MHLSEISENLDIKKVKGVWSGQGTLSHLDHLTAGYKNILLFVDANGFEPCGAAAYFQNLGKKKNIKTITYTGKALPIEDIETIYRSINTRTGIDAVIAVGGGTVIDLAKILAVACSNRCEKAEEVLDNKRLENTLPLLFIPTTAGTGSETTTFAVVYRDKVKISVLRESIQPEAVILDPLLLRSLPEPVLHATVLDALAQATESLWAVGSTLESKQYSAKAIPLILDNIAKENTIHRLAALQEASYWAGKAINISKTTLPHSISYPVTAHFGVPHGIAVFLTLSETTLLNYHTTEENRQDKIEIDRIKQDFFLLFHLYRAADIRQLKEKLDDVMVRLKVKTRLRDYDIKREDLTLLAANALTKGRSDNNPRRMSQEDVLTLLNKIF
ncbi:MAG: phosphonoacetaldehyde reductase [bacterium]|nr:phosphonoacetaldehyde reductase [bacterium]